ncbi:hypothetical protein ACH4A8_32400 [Streptomyces vietnamensis]|uniref:hypothetical protein n=1 Tax=Streptomyces vietnamensis TaxID=362257 RepID=UPI0037BAC09D
MNEPCTLRNGLRGALCRSGPSLSRRHPIGIVALDVPPEVDLAKAQRILDHGVTQKQWDTEEGCITDAWQAARLK